MGDRFTRDHLTIGTIGRDIVPRLQAIGLMGRTSRVIDRPRTMVVDAHQILEMAEGRRGMAMAAGIDQGTEAGLGLLGMEMEAGPVRRAMAAELGHPETEALLGMVEELDRLAMAEILALGPLAMVEAVGRLSRPVPHRRLVLLQRQGRHRRLVLLQRLLIGRLLVLLREDLIPGIRRVVRSQRNGLSRRLVRDRADLGGITMARQRGRRVIAAKPVLAVDVREVNRNEAFQA
jgi:hypothetical protein